jgi:hypothetical protein
MKGVHMILFYEDWEKFPNAIMDTKTKNKSFYVQAIKYKIMGIRNHGFLLSLLNPELQGVDPFDEKNLTRQQKDAIIVEILSNPWYYFREIVKVSLSGGGTSNLLANRANIALIWMFLNHIYTVLIQIRQSGKSLNTDAIKSYALFFGALDTAITFLTNTNKNRHESVERMRSIEKEFPSYLKQISSDDLNNMEKIYIKATKNRYETATGQKSLELAKNIHRGKTSPIRHIDEAAYIPNIKESLGAMLKTGTTADDQAKASGSLYGTIVSTTAGYKDIPHGRFIYNEIYKPSAIFTEQFFDSKNEEELRENVTNQSAGKVCRVLIEMNHRQLGKSDEWLAGKIEDTNSTGNETLTDYFNIWVDSRGKPLIDDDDMKKISESKLSKYNPEISDIEGYMIRWYITEEERLEIIRNNEPIIAGMDTSEALGNDDISLVIISVKTGEVLAAADFNETNTTIFGSFIADLLIKYPSMTLVIERRSTGTSIIDSITPILINKGINPLFRLFNWAVNDMHLSDKHKYIYNELNDAFKNRDRSVFDRHKKLFGFSTSGSGRTARNKLYSETFKAAIKYISATARDIKLINQLLGLKDINGRIDHDPDDHDDMVIGWLLAFWFLKSASNINRYGININNILINIKDVIYKNGEKDVERMLRLKKHNQAMGAISKLTELIMNSRNDLEINESKLLMKRLSAHIDYSNTPNFNIDVHIRKLEADRRLQIRLAS